MKRMMITMIVALVLAFSSARAGFAGEPTSQTGKQQVACPVRGGEVNKNIYVDYQGQRIYFCCPGCIDVFKKNPEAYLKKMREQGVVPEKTPSGS